MKKIVFSFFFLVFAGQWAIGADYGIVPKPVSIIPGNGSFRISDKTAILIDGGFTPDEYDLLRVAGMLSDYVKEIIGVGLPVTDNYNSKNIVRLYCDKRLAEEEYTLNIMKHHIEICGGTPKGVFYGIQTLRQLIASNGGELPVMEIKDKPYMAYRGTMLDVCRHFYSVEEVKKFIDVMAMHKMNYFHWHLTDDQGWRIEIKKYPELTKIGSVRKETVVGRFEYNKEMTYDGVPYGGYYTQEEIREVVRYASERYIDIIPEIEMPGHAVAALASYPYLGCTDGPYEVRTMWGVSKDVYCAGKETTFEFLKGVLSEVIALFPSKYIHIGGDECPKDRWKICEKCQQRIKEENLKDENHLQSYFVNRIEKYLQANGRQIIGWDEILEDGISKTAIIMSWRDQNYGLKAAQSGNKVIMTPRWYCYFDYYQTSNPEKYEYLGIGRYLPVRQVYRLDPYDRLTPKEQKNILGVQANVWTEYIPDSDRLHKVLLPRLAALSEVAWSYDRKQYNDFLDRLTSMRKLYDVTGMIYSTFVFDGIE